MVHITKPTGAEVLPCRTARPADGATGAGEVPRAPLHAALRRGTRQGAGARRAGRRRRRNVDRGGTVHPQNQVQIIIVF